MIEIRYLGHAAFALDFNGLKVLFDSFCETNALNILDCRTNN